MTPPTTTPPSTRPPTTTPTSTTPTPTPTGTATVSGYSCTAAFGDGCGPYTDPEVAGSNGASYANNQAVNPAAGETATMYASGLQDWQAVMNVPAGVTQVTAWEGSETTLTNGSNQPDPLSGFSSITSTLTLTPQNVSGASYDNGWDVWGGDSGTTNDYAYEMMIWTNQLARGTCGGADVLQKGVAFGSQDFTLCRNGPAGSGSEYIWYLSDASGNPVNETTSSVDIYAMLQWMIAHGYYPSGYGINQVTAGSEVCSTGGHQQTITMSKWTLSASS
jgi:hypothetical protein